MSILIPGKMPERCEECPCAYETEVAHHNYCQAVGYDTQLPDDGRPDLCPLIELPPHGRLIDADALWEKEKSERALKKHRPKDQSIIFDAGFLAGFRAAAQIASNMPTILPADPKGGEANG